MSLAAFIVALAAGGVVTGALFAVLLPRLANGGIVNGIVLGGAFTVAGGLVLDASTEIEYGLALALLLALSPFYLLLVAVSGGGGSWAHGATAGDSGDCGGGDSGGGSCG